MVVGDPPQPGGLRLQLVAGDREQPSGEVGASGVFLEPGVGGDEARLRDFVHIGSGGRVDGEPSPQRPFKPVNHRGEGLHIAVADPPNGGLEEGVGVGGR